MANWILCVRYVFISLTVALSMGEWCYEYDPELRQFYCNDGCCGTLNETQCCGAEDLWSADNRTGIFVRCLIGIVFIAVAACCCGSLHVKFKQRKRQRTELFSTGVSRTATYAEESTNITVSSQLASYDTETVITDNLLFVTIPSAVSHDDDHVDHSGPSVSESANATDWSRFTSYMYETENATTNNTRLLTTPASVTQHSDSPPSYEVVMSEEPPPYSTLYGHNVLPTQTFMQSSI